MKRPMQIIPAFLLAFPAGVVVAFLVGFWRPAEPVASTLTGSAVTVLFYLWLRRERA